MISDKAQTPKSSATAKTANAETGIIESLKNSEVHFERLEKEVILKPFLLKKTKPELDSTKHQKSHNYRNECIDTKEKFHQLKGHWNELVASSRTKNPFMLWEWMYTWWDVFEDKNKKLHIVATYENDILISVAPFYLKEHLAFFRCLNFIGEGEKKSDAIVTHYPDIIVSQEHRAIAVNQIVDYLNTKLEKDRLFDFAKFDLLKPDAVLDDISKGLASNIELKRQLSGNQFLIPLPSDDEAYIASLSKSARKQFRLKKNRLEKAGDFSIDEEKDLSIGLPIVEELHRSRWQDVVSSNVFDSNAFSEFHRTLCDRLKGQDIVDIRIMKLDGKPIVAAYNFKYEKACYSYLSGFSSEDDHRLSPMFTFDLLEIKRLIREGYHSFDLLVSESENNYKKRFGSRVTPCYKNVWIRRKSLISFMLPSYLLVKPYLSKIYNHLRTYLS